MFLKHRNIGASFIITVIVESSLNVIGGGVISDISASNLTRNFNGSMIAILQLLPTRLDL
jgi:hypothetical protein